MAAALSSCQSGTHATSGRGNITLNEEMVAVQLNEYVTLSVPDYIRQQQLGDPSKFKFQWYRNDEPIIGETRYIYNLGRAQYSDATYFTCKIYNGDLPDPLTLKIALSVTLGTKAYGSAAVEAPTTGPLQSGKPSSPVATNSCIPVGCTEYAQFKSQANNSFWWGPATAGLTCTAADTSGQLLKLPAGYDATLVVIRAQKNGTEWTYANYCAANHGTDSSVIFTVTKGDCYQFILCVSAPPPPILKIGQPLEVTFTGGW
jgi:hypothetical protein